MGTAVYFCRCSNNITAKVNEEDIRKRISGLPEVSEFVAVDLLCSEAGKEALKDSIEQSKPERVVIAACSPRDHEETFKGVLKKSGMNPFLLQMTNIREQVAWVVDSMSEATDKAAAYIEGAVARAALQEPLDEKAIDINPDVLVIGAGPAGLKVALNIAQSGRKVTLVEKNPFIGGLPVLFEEVSPTMECGTCLLEPLMDDILHGKHSENIELLTMSEVEEVLGHFGNFIVKIKKHARQIDLEKCIGCAECIEPCPVSDKNKFNCGMDQRKAISFPFTGSLPSAPFIDPALCVRSKGEDCTLCSESCPIDGVVDYEDKEEVLERNVGAVVVAVGAGLYDCAGIPNLGYGKVSGVYDSMEFERMLAQNGPTSGEITAPGGGQPRSVCIVHCVGSLDKEHKEYCSGICCQNAFKFNHILGKKFPDAEIYHLYKEIVTPGKEEVLTYRKARENSKSRFIRYEGIKDITVSASDGAIDVKVKRPSGNEELLKPDIVVLCPAVTPAAQGLKFGDTLGLTSDSTGFFEELHGRLSPVNSRIRGVYLAGACRAPADIQQSMNQAMASVGCILSELVAGRQLEVSPITASVDDEKCGGCMICVSVCPYKAITFDAEKGKAHVDDLLCYGCGTCVASCPAGAMKGNHFTTGQIIAEIEGLLGAYAGKEK